MQLTDSDTKINMEDLLNWENDLELELLTEYKELQTNFTCQMIV